MEQRRGGTKYVSMGKSQAAFKADNITAICEPMI
jgi:hypothetical protein